MAWDRLILTGAPPTPENYALWYHATGGTVEGLPEAMAELAQAGMLAQPGALDSIQARFFPNGIKAGGDGPAPAPTPEAKPAETRPSSLSLVYRVSGEAGDIMEAASAALSRQPSTLRPTSATAMTAPIHRLSLRRCRWRSSSF